MGGASEAGTMTIARQGEDQRPARGRLAVQERAIRFRVGPSAYRTLTVGAGYLVKRPDGSLLGEFPRTGQEAFSWFLCSCGEPPVARRARSTADLTCLTCRKPPALARICDCGVVTGDGETCAWCADAGGCSEHTCPQAPGLEHLLLPRIECPLCGERGHLAEPEVDVQAEVPIEAQAEIQAEAETRAETPVEVEPEVPEPAVDIDLPPSPSAVVEEVGKRPDTGSWSRRRPALLAVTAVSLLLLAAGLGWKQGWLGGASQGRPELPGSPPPEPRDLAGSYLAFLWDGELRAVAVAVDDIRWQGTAGSLAYSLIFPDGPVDGTAQLVTTEEGLEICFETWPCGRVVWDGDEVLMESYERIGDRARWQLRRKVSR